MKKNATPGQIAKIVEKLANGRISGRTAQAIIEGLFTVDGDSPLPATIVYLESDLLKRPNEVLAELDRKGLIPARKVDIDADQIRRVSTTSGDSSNVGWTSKKAVYFTPCTMSTT